MQGGDWIVDAFFTYPRTMVGGIVLAGGEDGAVHVFFSAMYVNILISAMTALKSHRVVSVQVSVTQFQPSAKLIPGSSVLSFNGLQNRTSVDPIRRKTTTFQIAQLRRLYTPKPSRPSTLFFPSTKSHFQVPITYTMAVRARFESSNECVSLPPLPHHAVPCMKLIQDMG